MKAKFINNLNLDNLKKEMKHYFRNRVVVPDEFNIKKVTATDIHSDELKRVKEEGLDYEGEFYYDFSDEEIPLITNDVYAAAYEVNLETDEFKIIDSFMHTDDFNLPFLKANINDKINYVIANVYGDVWWIYSSN